MSFSNYLLIFLLLIYIKATDYHGYLYSNNKELSGDFVFDKSKLPLNYTKYESLQMRHPQYLEDMLIQKININLKIEYNNFIHIKITDSNDKNRWEVPDIMSNDYLYNLPKNTKDKPSSSSFYNLYFTNESDVFSFELKDKTNNETFYIFSNDTFLFTDRFINFESLLTTDNI